MVSEGTASKNPEECYPVHSDPLAHRFESLHDRSCLPYPALPHPTLDDLDPESATTDRLIALVRRHREGEEYPTGEQRLGNLPKVLRALGDQILSGQAAALDMAYRLASLIDAIEGRSDRPTPSGARIHRPVVGVIPDDDSRSLPGHPAAFLSPTGPRGWDHDNGPGRCLRHDDGDAGKEAGKGAARPAA
jgi:hypothetical protein